MWKKIKLFFKKWSYMIPKKEGKYLVQIASLYTPNIWSRSYKVFVGEVYPRDKKFIAFWSVNGEEPFKKVTNISEFDYYTRWKKID